MKQPMTGMLWYKAWRESRDRFVVSAAIIALLCLVAWLLQNTHSPSGKLISRGLDSAEYGEHMYRVIYRGLAKGMFAMLAIFLGLGGLRRERSVTFTLALPASRKRIVLTQLMMAYGQIAALALLPAALIPSMSLLAGESYPLFQSLHFSVLWFVGGMVIVSCSYLLSVLLEGVYTAPVAALTILTLHGLTAHIPGLRGYPVNLMRIMSSYGAMRWNEDHTAYISDPLSTTVLLVLLVIAIGLSTTAVRIVERQDY